MKKAEAQFDRVTKFSKRVTSDWNVFLIFGYISMAVFIVAEYMSPTVEHRGGLVGIVIGYIGLSMNILALDGRSRKSKIFGIIAMPLAVFFLAQLPA